MDNAQQPLLQDSEHQRPQQKPSFAAGFKKWAADNAEIKGSRQQAQRFLTSKAGHYSVLGLVILDVSCIFADFVITIAACKSHGSSPTEEDALSALGIVSLVFSSLFMLELLISIWAFGTSYFNSWFHIFDAIVIIAGFTIDVVESGTVEEVGSLVVVLRLWRVFKIIEELSTGAQEQFGDLQEENDKLKEEVERLKEEVAELKRR